MPSGFVFKEVGDGVKRSFGAVAGIPINRIGRVEYFDAFHAFGAADFELLAIVGTDYAADTSDVFVGREVGTISLRNH